MQSKLVAVILRGLYRGFGLFGFAAIGYGIYNIFMGATPAPFGTAVKWAGILFGAGFLFGMFEALIVLINRGASE